MWNTAIETLRQDELYRYEVVEGLSINLHDFRNYYFKHVLTQIVGASSEYHRHRIFIDP